MPQASTYGRAYRTKGWRAFHAPHFSSSHACAGAPPPPHFEDAKAAPGKGKSRRLKALGCCTWRRNSGALKGPTSAARRTRAFPDALGLPAAAEHWQHAGGQRSQPEVALLAQLAEAGTTLPSPPLTRFANGPTESLQHQEASRDYFVNR
jgi:hypothetical protein